MCFEVLGINDSIISVLVAINKKQEKTFVCIDTYYHWIAEIIRKEIIIK